MSRYSHTVTTAEQGKRLDVLLASLEGVSSRAAAVRLLEAGRVSLNGTVTTAKKRVVLHNDCISYEVVAVRPPELLAEDIELDLRYEDDDLAVICKPAGLVVHPAQGNANGTLVNALIARYGYEGLALLQGADRPGIVHRLDKDTSGLMLVAFNDEAGWLLQEMIRNRAVDRRYLALVHGAIAPQSGLIDAPIARGGADRQRMVVAEGGSARDSVTTFEVLRRFAASPADDGYTLLECKLFTGRTHQIRVHMEYIGHPCVGDALYGSQNRPRAQLGLRRQFLHSWRLSFNHPLSGEAMEFNDAPPPELQAVLDGLEGREL
ncbi:MAG: RluA family pseudouridine synthase [Coriobacteriales bacterium]|jgi:23S rRNA pseudouridine1911/1915/1917 synthase|nr:RluA family pseudouridine synthase [Coriobacteriales bacterium]